MASLEGLDELFATLSGLGGNVKESARKGLERGAKRIQANAKYLCPVRKPKKDKNGKEKSDGGHLRNSIKTKSEVTLDGAKAQVFSNLEYAKFVNFRHWTKTERNKMIMEIQYIIEQIGQGKHHSHL